MMKKLHESGQHLPIAYLVTDNPTTRQTQHGDLDIAAPLSYHVRLLNLFTVLSGREQMNNEDYSEPNAERGIESK
jgi:hypothetical protein